MKRSLGIIWMLLSILNINAQDNTIDSLKLALKNAKHDTTKLFILVKLSEVCDLEEILVFAEPAVTLAESKLKVLSNNDPQYSFYIKLLSGAYNNMGYSYDVRGEMQKALIYYSKSFKIDERLNNKKGMAGSLNNISLVYKEQGDAQGALKSYHQCLKLYEELNDKSGMGTCLNNIALLYQDQGEIIKALDYFNKSLKYREAVNDRFGIANSLNNIGSIYGDNNNFSKAIAYHLKSLKIKLEINDEEGIATSYNNLGAIYKNMSFDKQCIKSIAQKDSLIEIALDYYNKSLKIFEKIKNKRGITYSLSNISSLMLEKGNVNGSLMLGLQSFKLSNELKFPANIKRSAEVLKKIYQTKNMYKEALKMYELEIQMRDSISNVETKKASIKKQFQYQYEKKAAADSVENEEEQKIKNALLTVQQAQLKQEKTKSYALYGGLTLVLVFTGFMVNRFRVTNKQKQIIELKEIETQKQNEIITIQKHLVEEKHKEITDSINYAERIQRSFLATTELLNNNLSVHAESRTEDSYFVFFQPKDVVSGDFYWASKLSNGCFALATADSTGHGVPGAIMSILNISCLEKAVEQEKLTEPAEILNHTRTKIIERLKKDGSEEGGKDGMDCSLICFDFKNSKLTYAAANNPVWIVRASTGSA
ncbi:MAG: tetratricopeptide repeat protein, partial [Burkholderiales bacterium]|nr:tetratricopeptide repeat protein [Bacteroidia bacterium]